MDYSNFDEEFVSEEAAEVLYSNFNEDLSEYAEEINNLLNNNK